MWLFKLEVGSGWQMVLSRLLTFVEHPQARYCSRRKLEGEQEVRVQYKGDLD